MTTETEFCKHCHEPIMEFGFTGSGAFFHTSTDSRFCKDADSPEWDGTHRIAERP